MSIEAGCLLIVNLATLIKSIVKALRGALIKSIVKALRGAFWFCLSKPTWQFFWAVEWLPRAERMASIRCLWLLSSSCCSLWKKTGSARRPVLKKRTGFVSRSFKITQKKTKKLLVQYRCKSIRSIRWVAKVVFLVRYMCMDMMSFGRQKNKVWTFESAEFSREWAHSAGFGIGWAYKVGKRGYNPMCKAIYRGLISYNSICKGAPSCYYQTAATATWIFFVGWGRFGDGCQKTFNFFGVEKNAMKQKKAPRTRRGWNLGRLDKIVAFTWWSCFFEFRGWSLWHEDFRCVTVSLEILFFYIGPPTLGLQNPWKMRIERPNKYGTSVITPKYEGCEFPWHLNQKKMISRRIVSLFW